MSPLTFLKQVRSELVKVEWPTPRQVLKLTVIVLGASVVVGAYLGALDALFTSLLGVLVQ